MSTKRVKLSHHSSTSPSFGSPTTPKVDVHSPKRMSSPDSTSSYPNSATAPKKRKSRVSQKDDSPMDQLYHHLENVSNFIVNKLTKDPVFTNYSPHVLSPGLDKIVVQAHDNNKDGENVRKQDKYNICY